MTVEVLKSDLFCLAGDGKAGIPKMPGGKTELPKKI